MHRMHYKERVSFNDEKAKADKSTIYGNNNVIFGNSNIIHGDGNHVVGEWNTINGDRNYIVGKNNGANGNDNVMKRFGGGDEGEPMEIEFEIPQQQQMRENFVKIPAESLQPASPGSEMMSFVGHYQIEPTESQAGHLLMKHQIAPSRQSSAETPSRVYGKPMKMAAPAGEFRCYMGDPQGLNEWHAKWDAEKKGNPIGIQLKEPETLEQLYAMDRNDLMKLYDDGFISKEQLSKVQFGLSIEGNSPPAHQLDGFKHSLHRSDALAQSAVVNQFNRHHQNVVGNAMQNAAYGMIQNHNNNIDEGYPPSLEVDGGYRVFKSGSMSLNAPRVDNSIQNNNVACSPAPMVYEQQKGKLEVPTEEEAEKHDIESDDPNNVCITCLENKPICVIIPCMHAIMCCECARTVAPTLCPKCRDPTQRIVRLKM